MRRVRRSVSVVRRVRHLATVASSCFARSMVSAKRRIAVSGVRSSWLTLDTKSAWSSLRFASRRTKTSTRTMPVAESATKLTVRMPKTTLSFASPVNIRKIPTSKSSTVGMMTR